MALSELLFYVGYFAGTILVSVVSLAVLYCLFDEITDRICGTGLHRRIQVCRWVIEADSDSWTDVNDRLPDTSDPVMVVTASDDDGDLEIENVLWCCYYDETTGSRYWKPAVGELEHPEWTVRKWFSMQIPYQTDEE